MNWKAISHSSIGVQHKRLKMPCQDYAAYQLINDKTIIGAIADGASSAKLSDQGAELVVTKTIKYLTNLWQNSQLQKPDDFAKNQFLETILDSLHQKANQDHCSLKDLSCTLIAFMATSEWVFALQIGDGFLVIREEAEEEYQLVFKPDKGEFANETTFVTSDNAIDQMQVKLIQGYYPFICASTDALETVAIRQKDGLAFPPFFKPLEDSLLTPESLEESKTYLVNFLDSERLNARTHDDKTLLLCLHQHP